MSTRRQPKHDDDIRGMSMSASSKEKQDYIARLRGAGLGITAATRDDLPPPKLPHPEERCEAGERRSPSMSASSERKQAYIARLRAAGLVITPATLDELPPPEHTLPVKRLGVLARAWYHALAFVRTGRVRHAPVP